MQGTRRDEKLHREERKGLAPSEWEMKERKVQSMADGALTEDYWRFKKQ